MSHPWIHPPAILAALEAEADRRDLEAGRSLFRRGKVSGLREQPARGCLEVRGVVADAEGAVHRAAVTVSATRVDARCDCARETWPCRHALALVLAWASRDEASAQATPPRDGGWRDLLAALAPRLRRSAGPRAEPFLGHWVDLRELAAG
ncbi:MAG: SWIM zinc finger family protein, partial [Deferrisomatales bacterium]